MSLTPAQLVTLKAAIAAEVDVPFAADRAAGNTGAMAVFYNGASTFIVWRTRVPVAELQGAYSWPEIIALTSGQEAALNLMLSLGYLNASDSNVRSGMSSIFTSAPTTLTALTALGKRAATRGEKAFATGTGTTVTPGLLVFEGSVSGDDIVAALRS